MTKLYKSLLRFAILLLVTFPGLSALAATFPVTNTNNSGAGSLAQAILDANGTGGADIITFNLPTDQPCIITLSSALPVINEEVFIDGYSQPGASAGPFATRVIRVNINAAAIGAGNSAFTISADNVTIAGLAIYGAPEFGIKLLSGANNGLRVWGNFIGTDSTGITAGLGNQAGNIEVNFGSASIVSTGHIIGVDDNDAVDDTYQGNLIVGTPGTSGNNGDGILLWRCSNSAIAGNMIGLDKNGASAAGLENGRDGIVVTVSCTGVVIGTDGDGVSDDLEGNIIGNSGRNGIQLAGISTGNIIAGNTVGLDAASGTAGNAVSGIYLVNASNNRVGTDGNGVSDVFERNIISANGGPGLKISTETFFGVDYESGSDNNVIKGNIIGADAALNPLGNVGNGIELQASPATLTSFSVNNNFFGTDHDGVNDAVERNIIVNNAGYGIRVLTPAGGTTVTGNKFSGNLIYDNAQAGIDLQGGTEFPPGITINDDGDADGGANDLLNAPVITTVNIDGSDLVIEGFTRPNSMVEFYIPDGTPIPGGGFTKSFGQGQVFLFRAQEGATLSVTNDDDATTSTYSGADEGSNSGGTRTENRFSFRVALSSLPVAVTAGTGITSLAYLNATGAGSTSEFGGTSIAANLPVHFVSFNGRIRDGKAILTWVTAEEQNNDHFEVQRSTTGGSYTTIGRVNPKSGVSNQYDFTDAAPAAGISYYRLKQVDLDGRFMYSKILILRSDLEKFVVKTGPNPFSSNINIYYQLEKDEAVIVRMYDQAGRTVKQYTTRGGAGVNTYTINDLNNLPKGNYTLELSGETVKYRQQVVKQ